MPVAPIFRRKKGEDKKVEKQPPKVARPAKRRTVGMKVFTIIQRGPL